MPMHLFEHNQTAYNAAITMLAERGKAAVIHPTGTGKSFIGFKLCEDNPDKTICWLSPSRYIYQTQLENLAETSDGYQPDNVKFYTYAKLMNVSKAEIDEIKPDYIILDEFHRCGAELWGAGVDTVLKAYPNVPVLGLSATSIRYLDNQRNMAEELFNNCIASEMTLGEAIVRDIIKPPKYIQAIYSYQDDLERYERRVKRAKTKITRDIAEEYLNKLRHMLNNAVGIGEIFQKHIKSVDSKYIVFCSSYEHMLEMTDKCRMWLYNIDPEPKIYSVYTLENDSDKQFTEFKNDNDHEHLKFLFCIDALNEGVHVDNISGVILLRPTVSPIVFKQQIGRALTAGTSGTPVIFDIVNNVENLYSIGALREEIENAHFFFESTGRGDLAVNDMFQVIDEVADVRKLFSQLDDVLSSSWEQMFELAKDYYEKNGNTNIQATAFYEGYPLGSWLQTQRTLFRSGGLDTEKQEKLEAIGVCWTKEFDRRFEMYFAEAKKYYEENGDLLVPGNFVSDNGIELGKWIYGLRESRRYGRISELTDAQTAMLESIGMDWDYSKHLIWDKCFEALKEWRTDHPTGAIPEELKTPYGRSLRSWQQSQIQKYRSGTLSTDKAAKLQSIGVPLDPSDKWMKAFREVERLYHEKHHLNISSKYVYEGIWLSGWLKAQTDAYFGKSKRVLTTQQRELLKSIGIDSYRTVNDRKWQENYLALCDFIEKNDSMSIPGDFKTPTGVFLQKWAAAQRKKYKKGQLTDEQISLLEKIGFKWENDTFEQSFSYAERYYNEHGDLNVKYGYVTEDGFPLGKWLKGIRARRKDNRVPEYQILRLDSIGMVWDKLSYDFQVTVMECVRYFEEHGDLNIPLDYVSKSGIKLNYWIADKRRAYRNGKLTAEQIDTLRQVHII